MIPSRLELVGLPPWSGCSGIIGALAGAPLCLMGLPGMSHVTLMDSRDPFGQCSHFPDEEVKPGRF